MLVFSVVTLIFFENVEWGFLIIYSVRQMIFRACDPDYSLGNFLKFLSQDRQFVEAQKKD